MQRPENIDQYIAAQPEPVRILLEQLRTTIRTAAPAATEAIRYAMPTFQLAGNLVHFAAFTAHIGFYPTASGIAQFRQQLVPYPTSKGAIRFALDQPLPLALVREIVRFRVAENLARAAARSTRRQRDR